MRRKVEGRKLLQLFIPSTLHPYSYVVYGIDGTSGDNLAVSGVREHLGSRGDGLTNADFRTGRQFAFDRW